MPNLNLLACSVEASGGGGDFVGGRGQGSTKFFAAYKQISLIGSVPTKFTINSTTNWGLCLQAALACLPTLSGPESYRAVHGNKRTGTTAVCTALNVNFDVLLRGKIGRLHHDDATVRRLLFPSKVSERKEMQSPPPH